MVISLYLFPFLYVIAVRGRRINLAQGAGNAKTGTGCRNDCGHELSFPFKSEIARLLHLFYLIFRSACACVNETGLCPPREKSAATNDVSRLFFVPRRSKQFLFRVMCPNVLIYTFVQSTKT